MQLQVVAVGRMKNAALRTASEEYLRRVGRYVRIDVREVAVGRGRRPADVRREEGERLLGVLPAAARAVALTRTGETLSSAGLADRLAAWQRGARDVVLLIGGATGLDERVLARCETHLSLSALTLPHELARVVLLEQLYRACTILKGEPYHKGG